MPPTLPTQDLTVLGEVASGGMGTVELARLADAEGERFVAVKRMHPEYARDPEFVRMFRDEIWLTGSLSHPNVVGLVGWGEDEAGPYLVMEYVEGVALARVAGVGRRAGEPISSELIAYIAARSADGLHAAHSLRDEAGRPLCIVHRDVTPSNILVGFDGSVKITDFGIAKAIGKSSHTRTGIIKGKIAYMSPEYALRRPVDGRSDLYSLGIVIYELSSGGVPFSAKGDLELLKLVAYASPPGLGSVATEVDPGLASIADRLLAKDPNERYTDGAALAQVLDAWLEQRGRSAAELEAELREYASKHAGTARHKLTRMLDEDASTVPGDADSPKRPRFETKTFTRFRAPPAREWARDRRDSDKPQTRRVSVHPPAPSAPVRAVPVERRREPPGRPSHPPPLVAARRQRSSAVVGGVIAGSVVALVLVVLSVLAAARKSPGAEPEPEPELHAQSHAQSPPGAEVRPSAEPTPPPSAAVVQPLSDSPPTETAPAPAASLAPKPKAAKVKGSAVKIVPPSKATRTCTPDSFDYPACLKR